MYMYINSFFTMITNSVDNFMSMINLKLLLLSIFIIVLKKLIITL